MAAFKGISTVWVFSKLYFDRELLVQGSLIVTLYVFICDQMRYMMTLFLFLDGIPKSNIIMKLQMFTIFNTVFQKFIFLSVFINKF